MADHIIGQIIGWVLVLIVVCAIPWMAMLGRYWGNNYWLEGQEEKLREPYRKLYWPRPKFGREKQ